MNPWALLKKIVGWSVFAAVVALIIMVPLSDHGVVAPDADKGIGVAQAIGHSIGNWLGFWRDVLDNFVKTLPNHRRSGPLTPAVLPEQTPSQKLGP